MRPTPLVLCLSLASSAASSDDWTRWGGPQRTGVSNEADWDAVGRAKPLWSTEVGLGYSSVVVRGNRLYTIGHDKEAKVDVVRCLDAETGAEVWFHDYPAKLWDLYHGGGTLTTPTLDGERLFTAEREGQLFCFQAADGKVLWTKDQAKEFGLELPTWGLSASPYVHGDLVVMNVGPVIAYDKASGEVKWKSAKDYGHAYSTPAPLVWKGEECLAVFGGDGLVLLALDDGAELAFAGWETGYAVNAMTPVVAGSRVFISSGYERGCELLELADGGFEVVWESKVMRNHMSGSILWDEHLYGFDESVLKCIDLEGTEVWRERGLGKGALMIADGRLIVLSEGGELVIAEASPQEFAELSRAKVLDGSVCWTMPVLANGRIYCRNHAGTLVCLDHRPSKG